MIGAAVAFVAQLGLTAAPIAEGVQGRDAAAHVEAAGIATHYAHNGATCATCQARSLHGLAVGSPASLLRSAVRDAGIVSARIERVTAEPFSPNNPRAPPPSPST